MLTEEISSRVHGIEREAPEPQETPGAVSRSGAGSRSSSENPDFPDAWPTEGLVQVWDEPLPRFQTATRDAFLTGPSNTSELNPKGLSQ